MSVRAFTWRGLAVLVALLLAVGCATQPKQQPEADDSYGVLLMAHGGSKEWNERVLAAVEPLRDRYTIEVAFGMADAASLQEAVSKLEAQGVRQIGVVRLFISGESWYERTRKILGLVPGAPQRVVSAHDAHANHGQHAHHSMAFWQVDTAASFALSEEGLADAKEMDAILLERVSRLSRDPASEDVLILAHGPGDDAENTRWIEKISSRAAAVRTQPFRRVEVHTLREDWPEKREAAERTVRAFVERANEENGRAIVVPFRVGGFGPYAKVLNGLDYVADGLGLLPHPNVTKWIERQIETLEVAHRTERVVAGAAVQAGAR